MTVARVTRQGSKNGVTGRCIKDYRDQLEWDRVDRPIPSRQSNVNYLYKKNNNLREYVFCIQLG